MLFKTYFLTAMRFISLASVFILTGCVSEGAAFGLGSGSLHETVMIKKNKSEKPEVYGPPQVIYQIDESRYFTLENYTRCENGQTFYNNKGKGIHAMVANTSGYLFKGRLFWISTRDDYLAFPATADTNTSQCVGADKGCLNAVIVTTDGGKTLHGVPYGGHTTSPTEATLNYDILVNDDGFYLIYYRGKGRVYPVVDRWNFDKENWLGVVKSEDEYSLLRPGDKKPVGGFLKIDMSKFHPKKGTGEMQCDRQLEPEQSGEGISDE